MNINYKFDHFRMKSTSMSAASKRRDEKDK